MSLIASMWTGVTGLRGHGQKMGVIGNNIANVSTVGFKGSRMHFEDFMSQDITIAAGAGQIGRGVKIGTVLGDFSQGSLETTNEAVDVSISGNGFFTVSPPGQDANYYTRAGNFRFDKDGFYVDPRGYRVQGWAMENGEIFGVPQDIELDTALSPPAVTTNVSVIANLDSRSRKFDPNLNGNIWDLGPGGWDGTQQPPIAAENYTFQSTLKVYDDNGNAHNLSLYYRQREPAAGEDPDQKYWQMLVTSSPDKDMRDGANDPLVPESGLLFHGELIFDKAGELVDMELEYYDGGLAPQPVGAAQIRNGYPLLYADFQGTSQAGGAVFPDDYQAIELNLGGVFDANGVFDPDAREPLATTSYATGSTNLFQGQDGFTAGFLQNVFVDQGGVLRGRYSNGQERELFTLTLTDFNNVWGLRREGGNLFAETRESGQGFTGTAGTGRLGVVNGNTLELSNVDLATEFVKMISTQKGFQANSKTITTTDMMLDEVIRMKR